MLLTLPDPVLAHVRLESSTPARDAVVTASPPLLHLKFSAHIEQRYTQLTLIAPDSTLVPLGAVTFVTGSDREFTAAVPPLSRSGVYTVRWRTAGADGHPLEGAFTFTLALPAQPPPQPSTDTAAQAEHAHDTHATSSNEATTPVAVLGRGLHFVALTLILGALACRTLLLSRIELESTVTTDLRRRIWRTAAFATAALLIAVVFRLWLQSVAMHGGDRALQMPLLSLLLTDTSWGRVWVIQAILLAVFAAALVTARPQNDRSALFIAIPAALALATIPALTGHAAGAERNAALVVMNDALHVSAAGAWLGTLAILAIVVLPAIERSRVNGAIAALLGRFSALALSAAAVVAVSGVINSVLHFTSVGQLFATVYGRTLLLKVAFVIAVMGAGAYNWRRMQPRLAGGGSVAWRRSIVFELTFALLVFLTTAYLTGLPRPD